MNKLLILFSSIIITRLFQKYMLLQKIYNLQGAFSINSMRHLLANLIDGKNYSNKQVREVANSMGTSINLINSRCTRERCEGLGLARIFCKCVPSAHACKKFH